MLHCACCFILVSANTVINFKDGQKREGGKERERESESEKEREGGLSVLLSVLLRISINLLAISLKYLSKVHI